MSQALLFEHFRLARARRNVARKMPALAASAAFTASLLFAMWAKSIWDTEQLERPKHLVDLAIAPAPPPPPPLPKGGQKPTDVVIVPKVTVRVLVQPPKIEQRQDRPAPEVAGDKDGKEDGQEDGQKDGTGDNVFGVPSTETPKLDPPPELAKKPPVVPPSVLEASRIAGEKLIEPDDVTKTEIQRSGQSLLVGTFKLCISPDGAVASVTRLKPTGFPAYDHRIEATIANEWRYRPFLVEGKPTAACTAVTFKYSQH